ncbi:MAG TPA: hypothetical protein VN902_03075 [Candidatus Acidoferrales bacterium]|nr:hypothetical protein [Candidatus Acidoferrales bacterium]
MTMQLDETPKEKLANATRSQQRAEADARAASDALRLFDEQHANLDSALRQECTALESARAEAQEALTDAKDNFNFCHHQVYAMDQKWGQRSEPWRK